jgi:hypothetical protein
MEVPVDSSIDYLNNIIFGEKMEVLVDSSIHYKNNIILSNLCINEYHSAILLVFGVKNLIL